MRANHRRNAESTTSHQYVEQRAEDDGTFAEKVVGRKEPVTVRQYVFYMPRIK